MLICNLSQSYFLGWFLQLNDGLNFDEIYQLLADMGRAGYIFTRINDANVISNSIIINVNLGMIEHTVRTDPYQVIRLLTYCLL